MKIRELINELLQCNPENDVAVINQSDQEFSFYTDVIVLHRYLDDCLANTTYIGSALNFISDEKKAELARKDLLSVEESEEFLKEQLEK